MCFYLDQFIEKKKPISWILSASHRDDALREWITAATSAVFAREPPNIPDHTQRPIAEENEITPSNDDTAASKRVEKEFTLLTQRCQNASRKQYLTNVKRFQQFLLLELALLALAGLPISHNRLRILYYLNVTERMISISKGLDDGTNIAHLDQAELYVDQALKLVPLSGMACAQEQLTIERYIITGLRAYFEFRRGATDVESKQISLTSATVGMRQAWESLEKIDLVIFEKQREFVMGWIHIFNTA